MNFDTFPQLSAAIPHDTSRWSDAFTQEFVEKVCKVDLRIEVESPHAKKLAQAIQSIPPNDRANRDQGYMAKYNEARKVAKCCLDVEWTKFKTETGNRD